MLTPLQQDLLNHCQTSNRTLEGILQDCNVERNEFFKWCDDPAFAKQIRSAYRRLDESSMVQLRLLFGLTVSLLADETERLARRQPDSAMLNERTRHFLVQIARLGSKLFLPKRPQVKPANPPAATALPEVDQEAYGQLEQKRPNLLT